MKSNELATQIAPFKKLNSKGSLSAAYRSLCFTKDKVRACSNAAILDAKMKHGIGEETFVDTTSFLAVVDSLPEKHDIEFTVEEGVLHWKCGPARGKLATLSIDNMPEIPKKKRNGGWTPVKQFATVLELGGLSCGSAAATSTGMYGIVLDNRDDFCVYASDDVTISACFLHGTDTEAFPPLTNDPTGRSKLAV